MTDDPRRDSWSDELRTWASGVRPVGDVAEPVRRGVRRHRRLRAWAAAGGAAAVVAATAVTVAVLPGPADQGSVPRPPIATRSSEPAAGFTCALESRVFGDPPPIPDLAAQQQVVDRLVQLDSVKVEHAEPTALGVVALVVDDGGDQDSWAEPEVVDQLTRVGAAHVYEWDPSGPEVGLDAAGHVQQVLLWELYPALHDLRGSTRGVPGNAGLALWQEAGALLLHWKSPVPPEIEALAGTREDGVRVFVEPVTYSAVDVRRAQGRLQDWLERTGRRGDWSTAYACADGTGLVVGMLPRVADEPGLAHEIAEAAGMPVMVVPEGRPIAR